MNKRRLSRRDAALVLVVLGAGALMLLVPRLARANGCTDSWKNAAGGAWGTAANWTGGVPATTDDACLPALATSYTVTLTGAVTVHSLTLGASSGATEQTLLVQGVPAANSTLTLSTPSTVDPTGVLQLDSTLNGGYADLVAPAGTTVTNDGSILTTVEGVNVDELEATLVNATGATMEVKTGTLQQDTGTTTTNAAGAAMTVDSGATMNVNNGSAQIANSGTVADNGTLSLTGGASWTQSGGSETGNAISINAGTFTDSVGTGSFLLLGAGNLAGTIPAGQTVTVRGQPAINTTATIAADVTNNGTLVLDTTSSGGYASLATTSGATLHNNATFRAQAEGNNLDYLEAGLTNAAGGSVEVNANTTLTQDQGTTTTNDAGATITTDHAGGGGTDGAFDLTNASAQVVNNGTVADNGTVALSGGAKWTQSGGSETGNAVSINNTGALIDSVGTGSFLLLNDVSLSGTIPAGQTVTVQGQPATNSTATLTGANVTNNGTLLLDSQNNAGYAEITGSPLINNATITTTVEGTNLNYLETPLTNTTGATLTIQTGTLTQDHATTTTNNAGATITVNAGATLSVTNASAQLVNNGTVADNGTVALSGGAKWTQSGGSETGNAVSINNTGALIDSVGTGSFLLLNDVSLSGTIPAGQTVTVQGQPAINSTAILTGANVTNNGTLLLDSQNNAGYAEITGSPLINNATITTTVEGANLNYLETPLTNTTGAAFTIQTGTLTQDHATTTTNDAGATITVNAGATLSVTNASAQLVNNGTVADNGTVALSGGAKWTQSGGSETGNAVSINNTGALIDSVGTGSFLLLNDVSLSGTIPAGQTVTVQGQPAINSTAILTGANVTNNGTLLLDSQNNAGYAEITGSPLINNATITTTVEGTNLNYLETPLTNTTGATLTIQTGTLTQDHATTTTNDGTIVVDAGATLALINSSAQLNNNSDGTLAFQAASSSVIGTISDTAGGTLPLAGTADLLLLAGYDPPVGTPFGVINSTISGQFAATQGDAIAQYSSAAVVLDRDRDHTVTTVSASANPSASGDDVTYTATVTPGPNGVSAPTGAVTFYDGSTALGAGGATTNGGATTATLTTAAPPAVGAHAITAAYAGDAGYKPSQSAVFTQVVQPPVPSGGTQGFSTQSSPPQPPPPPTFSQTGNVAPVSGTVLVELPGSRAFVPLSSLRQVPIGSIVDATNGRVSVTTASNLTSTATQTADFYEGIFQLQQPSNAFITPVGKIDSTRASAAAAKAKLLGPYTDIALYGGDFSVCRGAKHGRLEASVASHKVVRKLWGSGKGTFRTVGSSASAAVRGTIWLTEDRCDGTLIEVVRGVVQVDDFAHHHRNLLVRAGHSYLA